MSRKKKNYLSFPVSVSLIKREGVKRVTFEEFLHQGGECQFGILNGGGISVPVIRASGGIEWLASRATGVSTNSLSVNQPPVFDTRFRYFFFHHYDDRIDLLYDESVDHNFISIANLSKVVGVTISTLNEKGTDGKWKVISKGFSFCYYPDQFSRENR